MLDQALELHRKGDLTAAEERYKALLESEPENFEALHFYGLLKQDQGQLEQALELVQRAIEGHPQAAAYQATAGSIYHARGELAPAIAHLEKALELDPNLRQGHNTLGYLQLQSGALEAAEKSLNTALRLDPDSAQVITNLGNAQLAQGRLEEALSQFQRALSIEPDSLAARASLAEALFQQGAYAIAEEAFRSALIVRPLAPGLRAGLARTLLAQDRYAEALKQAQRGLADAPDHFICLKTAGAAALQLGHSREAVDYLQRALLLRRGDEAIIEQLAAGLEAQGQLEQARQSYEAIAARRPTAAVRLLLLQARMGEDEAARAGLRQLLEKQPDRSDAALALAELTEDPAAALEVLDALAEAGQGDNAVVLKRAELAMASGQPQTTLSLLEQADTHQLTGRAAAQLRELRARALDQLGQFGEAARAFADVVTELSPPEISLRAPATDLPAVAVPDDGRSPPVMLTGLPGSGVGALASLLHELVACEVLTDRVTTPGGRRDFLDTDVKQRGGERPADTHLRLERRAYWNAADRLRRKVQGRVMLVDTIPVEQFDAAVIAHYFPGTTLLVAKRHPGDLLLHARTLGWRQGLLRANAIEHFYAPLLAAPVGLEIRWLDPDAVFAGEVDALLALAQQFDLDLDDLQAALAHHAPAWQATGFAAGHWTHYRENLALLGPLLTRLAGQLGYPS